MWRVKADAQAFARNAALHRTQSSAAVHALGRKFQAGNAVTDSAESLGLCLWFNWRNTIQLDF